MNQQFDHHVTSSLSRSIPAAKRYSRQRLYHRPTRHRGLRRLRALRQHLQQSLSSATSSSASSKKNSRSPAASRPTFSPHPIPLRPLPRRRPLRPHDRRRRRLLRLPHHQPTTAGLLIADVSGHGIPAALIASMVKLAATSQRANAADPAALLSGMNTVLHGNTQSSSSPPPTSISTPPPPPSATPPQLIRPCCSCAPESHPNRRKRPHARRLLLRHLLHRRYPLKPGDRLLLYTDGLLEAENADGEVFGAASSRWLIERKRDAQY